MSNASHRGGSHCRRHRGCEDKTWRSRADRVADHGIGRDVAAYDAETFGQSPFDDVDAVHNAIPRGDAGASGAVKTNGVDFVEIGEGPKFRRQITDAPDRGNVAIHRVK